MSLLHLHETKVNVKHVRISSLKYSKSQLPPKLFFFFYMRRRRAKNSASACSFLLYLLEDRERDTKSVFPLNNNQKEQCLAFQILNFHYGERVMKRIERGSSVGGGGALGIALMLSIPCHTRHSIHRARLEEAETKPLCGDGCCFFSLFCIGCL